MTTTDTPAASDYWKEHGYLRRAREVRPGWWIHFSGTWNPDTGEVDFTPFWRQVVNVEVLDRDPDDLTVRRRRITYADGSHEDRMAMSDVSALTARQAKEAGLGEAL